MPADDTIDMGQSVWDVDPEYPLESWKFNVLNDFTRLGYWDWVDMKREINAGKPNEFNA